MKIFIIANFLPEDQASGITKKINAQISCLRLIGHEVYYSAYSDKGISVFDEQDKEIFHKEFIIPNNRIFRLFRAFFLDYVSRKFIENNNFDIGYIRWHGLGRSTLMLLGTMRKNCNYVVMDTHGYFQGMRGGTNIIGKYITYTSRKNQNKVKKYLDLVLSETDSSEIFGVKSIKYDNGVNVDTVKPHNYKGEKKVLNLISVAHERIYHGYDRVIRSIKQHKNRQIIVKLHLVGNISKQTINLIKELHLEDSVILYGKKYGTELDNIYDLCNMGVGPVAQHRVGGKQGTGLKTKEYFAKGIPYIYSGNELLVPTDYPYIMKVPDDESMIDFEKVYEFYQGILSKPIVSDMRKFAKENFSWKKIYDEMFIYLTNIRKKF